MGDPRDMLPQHRLPLQHHHHSQQLAPPPLPHPHQHSPTHGSYSSNTTTNKNASHSTCAQDSVQQLPFTPQASPYNSQPYLMRPPPSLASSTHCPESSSSSSSLQQQHPHWQYYDSNNNNHHLQRYSLASGSGSLGQEASASVMQPQQQQHHPYSPTSLLHFQQLHQLQSHPQSTVRPGNNSGMSLQILTNSESEPRRPQAMLPPRDSPSRAQTRDLSDLARHRQQYLQHQLSQQQQQNLRQQHLLKQQQASLQNVGYLVQTPAASQAQSQTHIQTLPRQFASSSGSRAQSQQIPSGVSSARGHAAKSAPVPALGLVAPSLRSRTAAPTPTLGRYDPYPVRTRAQRNMNEPEGSIRATPDPMATRPTTYSKISSSGGSNRRGLPPSSVPASSTTSRHPTVGMSPSPPSPPPPSPSSVPSPPNMRPNGSDPPEESSLPPQAPISIHCPRADNPGDYDIHMADFEDEDTVEVTLNVDIPKTPSPAAAGDPTMTVLSVNPSWHCVFVETVQQQRIRTSIRIQFCPSPLSLTYNDHLCKIQRLTTLQVIGYASRQVELTRRICGQNLMKKGGLVVHLDPAVITYNEASYGFTLSLSSFMTERLCRSNAAKPDELLPLTRQQNSAYCRRNLKELYYDTISKDVVITLRPSAEIFYAHSVVLENYGCFREMLDRANREANLSAGTSTGDGSSMQAGGSAGRGREGSDNEINSRGQNSTRVAATQSVVDDEGYAQPLHPPPIQAEPQHQHPQQRSPRQPVHNRHDNNTGSSVNSGDRIRIRIEVQDVDPKLFRAMLHYMYVGHIPTAAAPLSAASPPTQSGSTLGGHGTAGMDECAGEQPSSSSVAAPSHGQSVASGYREDGTQGCGNGNRSGGGNSTPSGSVLAPITSITSAAWASSSSSAALSPPATSAPMPAAADFSWRELYEVAARFELTGLMHLSKLVLISRLDPDLAVRELFEWAYHYWALVPCYVSFLIENMDPDQLRWEDSNGGGGGSVMKPEETGFGFGGGNDEVAKSVLWPYHNRCPLFEDIMVVFLQMLNERKEVSTLV